MLINIALKPPVVDPQWNKLDWGSKWICLTVCWSAVDSEWGTTSVYFWITYVCFLPSGLPAFAAEPHYQHRFYLFLSKVSFEENTPNLKKNHVGLKHEWGFKGKYWLNWELLPFEVFFNSLFDVLLGVTYANLLVATRWQLKSAPHPTSLAWVCVVWRSERSLGLSALCMICNVKVI